GDKLNSRFKILPFDEMYGLDPKFRRLPRAARHCRRDWRVSSMAPEYLFLKDMGLLKLRR
ncbi:MAG: hypothetical protein ACKO7B_17805, partial [Flavobacteriales bacterium]